MCCPLENVLVKLHQRAGSGVFVHNISSQMKKRQCNYVRFAVYYLENFVLTNVKI